MEIVAAGLTNPRGFTWAADGTLYVALAGNGGDKAGVFAGGPSPLLGGPTSSIVKIESGCPVTVADGLPSGILPAADWVWGVMDIVFMGDKLYALFGGGGEERGSPDVPNGVYRVNDDGTTKLVANLASWMGDFPPKFVAPDYGSDGSLFDMEAGADALWISEAVGGRLLKVTPDGAITLVADLSAGHLVPTGVALAPDGGAFVGFETSAPYANGSSKVVHVAADGTVTDAWTGLTMVTDVVLGSDQTLYAAEMATDNTDTEPFIHAGTGRIVHQTGPDSLDVVASGLDYPVSLGFGPGNVLYVTSPAFGADKGEGTIARVLPAGSAAATDGAPPSCAP